MKKQDTELMPCLSGAALLQQPSIMPWLAQLKLLISAPPDTYQELYLATLLRFAEFCQAMPFDVRRPQPYSLLQRQLELAITALKLRRGCMLPQYSESELIAEQEPLWTYAVFTTCLFTGFSRLQHDRIVELYLNKNDKIGEWSVLAGNLYEPETYYLINPSPSPALVDSAIYLALLIGRIIPACAIRWLANKPEVFHSWWQAITGEITVEKKDGLLQLIEQAAEKIDYPFNDKEPSKKSTKTVLFADQALEDILAWLQQRGKTPDHNPESDLLLRIPAGLFIDLNRIADFLNIYPEYSSQAHFLECLDNFLLKDNQSVLHRYRSSRFEKRIVLEGVILQEKYLSPLLKAFPMQSSFVPDPL